MLSYLILESFKECVKVRVIASITSNWRVNEEDGEWVPLLKIFILFLLSVNYNRECVCVHVNNY